MLEVEGLTLWYPGEDSRPALDNVGFSVKAGEKAALIGPNGAGKSTLLLCLLGLLEGSPGGRIRIDGLELNRNSLRQIRSRAGLVFQDPDNQLFMPTVYQDLAFGLRDQQGTEEEKEGRIVRVLEDLSLTPLRDRLTSRLSGGEKRLAALGGILVRQPSLILLDEPAAYLDPRRRRELIHLLASLPQTLLVVTHDLDMAWQLCSRVILLAGGRIAADGPAKTLLRDRALLESCDLEVPLGLQPLT
ncbi:MAG: energy-coupling factor ABC transporter ATP-binding protein [Spirochaetales bacterium]|jgi:cobalt/nickel transport system ATP-binding protein|nr:energy-coupling factor ABC transporter ATP-binding protein [Spirochaetales bacterium]